MSWRLARSLETLSDEVQERFPDTTIWTIGDADHRNRASDHNPNGAGVVCAIDVLGREQAAALWAHLLKRRDPREKYQIHARRIVSSTVSPWETRYYDGNNPHLDHIHVSVGRGQSGSSYRPDLYDDPAPWGFTEEDDMTPEQARKLDEVHAVLGIGERDDGVVVLRHTQSNLSHYLRRELPAHIARLVPEAGDVSEIVDTIRETLGDELAREVVKEMGEKLST